MGYAEEKNKLMAELKQARKEAQERKSLKDSKDELKRLRAEIEKAKGERNVTKWLRAGKKFVQSEKTKKGARKLSKKIQKFAKKGEDVGGGFLSPPQGGGFGGGVDPFGMPPAPKRRGRARQEAGGMGFGLTPDDALGWPGAPKKGKKKGKRKRPSDPYGFPF